MTIVILLFAFLASGLATLPQSKISRKMGLCIITTFDTNRPMSFNTNQVQTSSNTFGIPNAKLSSGYRIFLI
jgi:hypothetical protein